MLPHPLIKQNLNELLNNKYNIQKNTFSLILRHYKLFTIEVNVYEEKHELAHYVL